MIPRATQSMHPFRLNQSQAFSNAAASGLCEDRLRKFEERLNRIEETLAIVHRSLDSWFVTLAIVLVASELMF